VGAWDWEQFVAHQSGRLELTQQELICRSCGTTPVWRRRRRRPTRLPSSVTRAFVGKRVHEKQTPSLRKTQSNNKKSKELRV